MDPDLPFVNVAAGGRATTDPVAALAVAAWGLPAPEWLDTGMNGVYAAGDVVVRVGRPNGLPARAGELARVLAAQGVRVVQPVALEPVYGPDGLVATAWERLFPSGDPIDWVEVGMMVARTHALQPEQVPRGYPLPWCGSFPWWQLDNMLLAVAPVLDPAAAEGLAGAVERCSGWAELADEIVVSHGDVHRDNVVMTAGGPVLLDWDLLCRAPRAWDHAPMLRDAERWGGQKGAYEAFADGYGVSYRGELLAEALAELRLVAATLMRVVAGRIDASARAEADRRLRYWRGDADAPMWTPV